jgi:hypothetical protein
MGLYYYALGWPIEQVRHSFSEATSAHLRLFELRGTEEPFPVTLLRIDPSKPVLHPERVTEDRGLHDPGSKDFSLTNPRAGLLAVLLALTAGEYDSARILSGMIWDPPGAKYIAPNSVVCTTDEQHLAYALRAIFEENLETAQAELLVIRAQADEGIRVALQKKMLLAMISGDSGQFLSHLNELIAWHELQAPLKKNRSDPDYYLCLPALGLSVMAVRSRIISTRQLPGGCVFFPHELIAEPAA